MFTSRILGLILSPLLCTQTLAQPNDGFLRDAAFVDLVLKLRSETLHWPDTEPVPAHQPDIFGPPLPDCWPREWPDRLTGALHFNPDRDAIKAEIKQLLVKELDLPPWTHDDIVRRPGAQPSVLAGTPMGLAFLIGGSAGWAILGAGALIAKSRRPGWKSAA